jgi:DNA polymerase-4
VVGLSLDEAYLDVTGPERLHGDGRTVAAAIKRGVREELALVASVGVAPVKLAAKIASDLGKPDGLVVVDPGQVAAFLAPLPLWRLWGVGEVLEKQLRGLGLATIGDVATVGSALAARVGAESALRLGELARGHDDRAVEASRAAVSVGSEDTFDEDERDRGALAIHLLAHADRTCSRVRALEKRARVVTIKVKFGDHELLTRRRTLPRPTADGRVVGEVARELLAQVPAIERRGVRLTGISLSGLVDAATPRQLDFDEADAERGEALGAVQDRIAARFGPGALRRAVHLKE